MAFIKFPTMLYMGGDVRAQYATAQDEDDVESLKAQGYREPFDYGNEVEEEEPADTLEAAREDAKALGLTVHHKASIRKIRAAIAAKKLENINPKEAAAFFESALVTEAHKKG